MRRTLPDTSQLTASRRLPPLAGFVLGILFLIPHSAYAGVSLSGSIEPTYMFRTSDLSELKLPFRIANAKLNYEVGDLAIKANGAIETRWSDLEDTEFQLREAYLVWYPSFGEVSIGKQILVWGAVDGNNPTDNLSAYDLYYLFSTGAERKLGSLAALADIYLGDWTVSAAVIPWHQENRMPFNEPDFPLRFTNPGDNLEDADDPLEFGMRIKTSVLDSDLSLSYFRGHDRMHSPFELNRITKKPVSFGYRLTRQAGADLVTFISVLTLRAEAAYFITETPDDVPNAHEARYTQYAVQLEYTTSDDAVLQAQLLGSDVLDFESDGYQEEKFRPGMGMPLVNISDRLLALSATGYLMDRRLELKANAIENLEDEGRKIGGELTWSPVEAFEVELGISWFMGDEDDPDNSFGRLEDFSHYTAGIRYSF
jgi:hypothetical protein